MGEVSGGRMRASHPAREVTAGKELGTLWELHASFRAGPGLVLLGKEHSRHSGQC